jgi:quinol monooxygenase YgiN
MLLLLAELNAKPSAAAEVETILESLVDVARNEAGCVSYTVHRQQASPNDFVVCELYRDRAACDAHLTAAPVQRALRQFEALLATPPRVVFCDTLGAAKLT